MKYLLFFIHSIALILLSTMLHAQTLFVKPSAEIPVRRGQGTDYKIVAIVQAGTALTLLKEENGWALVQLQNGKQGWILKRYLNETPPPRKQVTLLLQEKEQLTTRVTELQNQLDVVTEAQGNTAQELSACIAEKIDISDKYQALENDTKDIIETKKSLAAAQKEIEQLKNENTDLMMSNSVLKKNESVKWFLAGSLVLLTGWIIGRFFQRSQKKRSSLLS
jgi:SH3 domain protein